MQSPGDMNKLLWIPLIILLHGCFAEDDIVIPREVDIVEIPYSMYESQIWYSLSGRQIVAHNIFSDWDLGFESSGNSHRIILNTAKFMYAGNTGSNDFTNADLNDCDTLIYDDSRGIPYKTALDAWADFSDPGNPVFSGDVFIIDRGINVDGSPVGYKKIVFEKYLEGKYFIHFSNLDGTDELSSEIPVDPQRNFTLFSFDNAGSQAVTEPPSESWDLCFTQYSTILFDDFNVATPYLVRGVLINQKGVSAVADSVRSFYQVTADVIPGYQFSTDQDAIGYEWKIFRDEMYIIEPDVFYLVKDQNNDYFKLKFTGYYNLSGARGYASFMLEEL